MHTIDILEYLVWLEHGCDFAAYESIFQNRDHVSFLVENGQRERHEFKVLGMKKRPQENIPFG